MKRSLDPIDRVSEVLFGDAMNTAVKGHFVAWKASAGTSPR